MIGTRPAETSSGRVRGPRAAASPPLLSPPHRPRPAVSLTCLCRTPRAQRPPTHPAALPSAPTPPSAPAAAALARPSTALSPPPSPPRQRHCHRSGLRPRRQTTSWAGRAAGVVAGWGRPGRGWGAEQCGVPSSSVRATEFAWLSPPVGHEAPRRAVVIVPSIARRGPCWGARTGCVQGLPGLNVSRRVLEGRLDKQNHSQDDAPTTPLSTAPSGTSSTRWPADWPRSPVRGGGGTLGATLGATRARE